MVVGSPNHYSNFVPNTTEFFPDAFVEGIMSGTHKAPHAADLIRLPLLHLYGGVWIDVGFMLFRNLDDLCWGKLMDPTRYLQLFGFKMTISAEVAMFWNGFIAARKGCVAVKHWHGIFLKLWKGAGNTAGMSSHPIIRHLPRYESVCDISKTLPPTGMDLRFFETSVLIYECVTEVYWAQHLTHWDGRKQFELLNRRREDAIKDESYFEADAFVTGILDTSPTMKLSHGLVTEKREYLARIWDEPENSDADTAPGTFAEYLRWASENFHQTKDLTSLSLPLMEDALISGGLLDVIGDSHQHWEKDR
ncbi:putative glycosyl transferase [Seiridium cardinale]|uniref:Glycosyl transferase n=1 Tax=Seiridium cardinale TaxID=138064 RepID=A0ABR2XX17_9PEZI